MNTTETVASSARRLQRGVLAILSGRLSFKGIPAPKIIRGIGMSARGLVAILVFALVGLFAFVATPVLAASPTFTVDPTSTVGYTTAQVSGTVNPENHEVFYWVDYAKDPAVEGWTPGPEAFTRTLASGSGSSSVSETLTGLTPGTGYEVRLHAFAASSGEEWFSPEPYVAFTTKPVTKPTVTIAGVSTFTSTTAQFSGMVDPNAPGAAPGQDPAFNIPWHFQCTPECPGLAGGEVEGDDTAHEVTAEATGLRPNVDYKVELVASNAGGETIAGPQTFHTPTIKPAIIESSVKSSGETTTTANIEAKVNPGGEATSYVIEYDTRPYAVGEAAHGLTATGSIPASSAEVPLERELEGLSPNTEYHWRLVATNAAGTTTSLDHTFVYTLGGGGLPDGREYELVTPAEKNGALIGGALNGGIGSQVADEGARMMSFSLQCFGGSPSCEISNTERQGVPVEFAREPSGWITHPLAPSAGSSTPGTGPAYSANVDTGEVLFQTPPPGENVAGGGLDWLGEQGGSFSSIGPVAEPGNPVLNSGLSASTAEPGSPVATPSFSHLVYQSLSPLWRFDPNSKPFEENAFEGKSVNIPSVYEYEGSGKSEPRLVALAPNSSELVSGCGAEIGGKNRYNYGALAEDGDTVYFEALPCTKQKEEVYGLSSKVAVYTLFARYDNSHESARSELISGHAAEHPIAGEACDSACQTQPASFANFEGASSDGSRVFFTDPHQLTNGAGEDTSEETSSSGKLKEEPGSYCKEPASGFTGCNLYESECPDHCSVPSERRLVDISAGDTSGEGPRVLATVAISKDGSHTYFVAEGVLTGANREGHTPANGEPNLYVYERDASTPGGRLSFVATLDGGSQTDRGNWNPGGTFGVGDANVTPDGRFLVFMSQAALTPDDTRTEANPPNQIYRYDAETGTLQRVSIGAQGFRDDGNEGAVGTGTFGNTGIVEAEKGLIKALDPLRTDPTMSDDGRFVFFHSPIGLTPHAANDVLVNGNPENPKYAQNIYEWEAPDTEVNGQIPCTEPAGCVFLISDGKDVAESDKQDNDISNSVQLLGSSGSGANVFFTTSDELVPQDTDTERDFYDAHICSTGEPCPPAPAEASPPCLGEVCHGIPAAQQGAPTGGTLTLNGLGNIGPATPVVKVKALTRAQKLAAALKVCHRDKKKAKRQSCEKRARAKYGPAKKKAKGKKSSNDRRASR